MLVRKDVLKLTIPILLEQTFILLLGVINAIMAGRVGKETVSAIGMVDSINNIFIAFFSALAIGGTVVVAHYSGRGQAREANEAAKQALASGLVLSIAITILIRIFRYPLMNLLMGSAEPAVLDNAFIYLDITLLTYPLIAMTSIACGVLRGAGDTRNPMKVTIMMNIINVVLSYVLIYGIHFGSPHFQINIPGMKIRGAALAIAAARTFGAVAILLLMVRGSKQMKMSRIKEFKFDMDIQKSIFGIGVPASVESLMFNGGKLITQIFIVTLGTVSMAANYVSGSVFSLVNIPGNALCIAATTLVGQSMGRGESEEAGKLMLYLTRLASLCVLIPCAIAYALATPLASLYTDSADVIRLSVQLMRISTFAMPLLWSVSFILPACLKAVGDAKYTMIIAILSMWFFRISLGYLLAIPLKFGVAGVWFGMFVDWTIRGTFYYIRVVRGKWKGHSVIKQATESISS